MRPARKAVRFCASALGALAEVFLSERYYPSDSRGTALPAAAASSSAFPCPSCLVTCCPARPSEKVSPWPAAWHCICSQWLGSAGARPPETVRSCAALASGAPGGVLRGSEEADVMLMTNPARTRHAWRTAGEVAMAPG